MYTCIDYTIINYTILYIHVQYICKSRSELSGALSVGGLRLHLDLHEHHLPHGPESHAFAHGLDGAHLSRSALGSTLKLHVSIIMISCCTVHNDIYISLYKYPIMDNCVC